VTRFKILLAIIAMFLVASACAGPGPRQKKGGPTAPILSRTPTEEEKMYNGWAYTYLNDLQKGDTNLALVMAVTTERSVPERITNAIDAAEEREKGSYAALRAVETIPPSLTDIDKDIQRLHEDHLAAYAEYREYFKDKDISHFKAGNLKLKTTMDRTFSVQNRLKQYLVAIEP
jgi:hypothetical protein